MKKFAIIATLAFAVLGIVNTADAASLLSDHYGVNISYGSRGARVMELQACMNAAGYNTGVVDGIYGPNTNAGVRAFQASKGLVVDGIVGVATTPAFQAACSTDTDVEEEEEEEVVVVDEEFTLGGEGDTSDYDVKSENDADANSKEEHIATIEFEVEDGDLELEKVELFFEEQITGNGTDNKNDNDIWENIENIRLVVDGKEIADVDVSDDDDWREHDDSVTNGLDVFSITLTGDAIFEEGDKVEIEILIDTTDEVESADDDETYKMWAELRFVNGVGVSIYEGDDEDNNGYSDSVDFAVEAATAFDLKMSENKNSPEDDEALDLSSDIDGEELVVIDVEIDDNQDGVLEDAEVDITVVLPQATTVSTVDADDLINEVTLFIDGDKVDDDDATVAITTSTGSTVSATITYKFDLDDFEVEADEDYEFSVEVDFKEIEDDSEFAGATIQVVAMRLDGEDAAGDNFTQETENTTTYAPVFTATAGLIDVNWSDAVVYSDGSDTATTGDYILFSLTVDNDSGSDVLALNAIANWVFDVEGYGVDLANAIVSGDDDWVITSGALPTIGANGTTDLVATLADGTDEEYFFMVPYVSTSSEDFTIELEEFGLPLIPVADTWED